MLGEAADKNKKIKAPAYQRIEEDIRSKVRDGRLPAGTMLAGRHSLAREYGVALSTAQQAVARLITDGILETSDRRGTFVAQPQPRSEREPRREQGAELPRQQAALTLGIVATARIDPAATPDVGSLWMRLAIRSLEQVFSACGGTTHFFERFPEGRGPYPLGLDEANAIPVAEAIQSLRRDGVDAIAVIGLCDAKDISDEVVRAVDVEQVPTVYLSWHAISPPLAQVSYDNRYAGYQAAQHLLDRGYGPLFFFAPFADAWLAERVEGARDAVRHAGLPPKTLCLSPAGKPLRGYDPKADIHCPPALTAALLTEVQALAASEGPAGIIVPNDATAYTVLDKAADCGLTAGADFGLIGFDDDARSCAAGLTTVRPPVEAMGEEAARLLLRALQGDKRSVQLFLRSHVIPRTSTSARVSTMRQC